VRKAGDKPLIEVGGRKGKSDTLTVGETESAAKRDRLEIFLNFSDELRRIAPGQKR
jgi:hypothetical protein